MEDKLNWAPQQALNEISRLVDFSFWWCWRVQITEEDKQVVKNLRDDLEKLLVKKTPFFLQEANLAVTVKSQLKDTLQIIADVEAGERYPNLHAEIRNAFAILGVRLEDSGRPLMAGSQPSQTLMEDSSESRLYN